MPPPLRSLVRSPAFTLPRHAGGSPARPAASTPQAPAQPPATTAQAPARPAASTTQAPARPAASAAQAPATTAQAPATTAQAPASTAQAPARPAATTAQAPAQAPATTAQAPAQTPASTAQAPASTTQAQASTAQAELPPGPKMSQPLDVFSLSSGVNVSAGAASFQFGVVGQDYELPEAPAGATVHKPKKEFGNPHTLVDSGKLKVEAGPQGEAKAEYFKHSAPGTFHAQGKAEAGGKLLSAEGIRTWQNGKGPGGVKGEASLGAKASAEGMVLADKPNKRLAVHGQVEGMVGAKAELEARQKLGEHSFVAGKAEGAVGAWGKVHGTTDLDPKHGTALFKAGYEGFAGAEIKAQGHGELGPVGVSAGVGAKAGVGGNFGIGAGMQSGRFEFNTDVGCAAGVGIGCGAGMVIDFKRMGKGLKKLFHHSPPAQQQPPPTNP